MKNKKRILALLLSLSMALALPCREPGSLAEAREAAGIATDWSDANLHTRGIEAFELTNPFLRGNSFPLRSYASRRINNGDPWLDTELKANISKNMDTDPTDDFHLYANKKWLATTRIPSGYSSWSLYAQRSDDVQKQCIQLLNDPTLTGTDAHLIQTLHARVLDWDARNTAGVSELRPMTDRILMIQNMDELSDLLTSKEGYLNLYTLTGMTAAPGLEDSSQNIVHIGSGNFLLGDAAEYMHRSELGDLDLHFYKDTFVYLAQRLGMSEAEAKSRFDSAIDFEKKLASASMTYDDYMSADATTRTNNVMTFDQLGVFSGSFPLQKMIENNDYRYDGDYLVPEPDYLVKLNEVYTPDNLEAIKSLLYIHYVFGYTKYLDEDALNTLAEISEEYYGSNGSISDEEMAFNTVYPLLPTAMQKTYVQRYGSDEDKQQLELFCRKVIRTYREMLQANTWASRDTIDYAIRKLESIKINVGYPDKWDDTNYSLDGKSLIECVDTIERSSLEDNVKLIGMPVDTDNWAQDLDLLSCNAFYSRTDNSINMVIGMMGDPFYSKDMSTEELYASLGAFWIGHEISHAFDSAGAQHDANGDFKDWWTSKDKKLFQQRVKKMDDYLDQIVPFGNYHVKGSNVDTEMIADMTGMQCALRMAKKERHFDYDKFFRKYAQMNASLSIYNNELAQLMQDPHPLDYLRTNVPVQQFPEFYRTYHVQPSDDMYLAPKDRLLIW